MLTQTARVLRPGGRLVIFDGDYASLTFGCADPVLGQEIETALQSMIMSSPSGDAGDSASAPDGGLHLVATQAHAYAEAGSSTFFFSLAETYAPLACSSGQLRHP